MSTDLRGAAAHPANANHKKHYDRYEPKDVDNTGAVQARLEPAEIDSLLKIYAANGISQEKLLEQLASGEILGDDFDIEEELEKTQSGGLIEMNQESEAA